ncbi:UvrD-helicase domain-containing protein [Duganella qianjiadongensis]|uniref:DNA 3'-5' helicase n=1 Tax=Duganella qianjiadongensis TaxID=2692176 RepID=A0ABW9VM44_9BURK|nr:UvrD-helicase domain-containing protein [Duganella qianjiadongensis]MYM39533.1 UvrD-helicase domain-containing protein [Duganella qianjiadongensis]
MNAAQPPRTARFIPRGLTPTAEQLAIQLAQHKTVLIDANAGAAKTTTLALRIGEALARNLAPEQILALTFTPEARDVLAARLLQLGVAPALVQRLHILTFEDFARWQLDTIDGDGVRQCDDARLLKPYALQAMDRVGARYAGRLEQLDLQTHSVALAHFLEVQCQLKASMALEQDVEFMDLDEISTLLGVPVTDYLTTIEYETLRLDGGAGAVFRGPLDASYDLACNLLGGAGLAAQLPDYRLVLCDELHDLNEAAFRLLDTLISRPACFFVGAGDRDQVIYGKLGAHDSYLRERFSTRYPKLQRLPLTYSFRHGPHLAHAMGRFKQKPVESALDLHTEIRQPHYRDSDECAQQVIAALRQWQQDGHALDQCAILLRERHQSIALENALIDAAIPYRTPAMAGYLQRDEILFLRGLLAIALQDFAAIKPAQLRAAVVDALVAYSEMGFGAGQIDHFKAQIAKEPSLLGELYLIEPAQRDGVADDYRSVAASATRRGVIDALAWLGTQDRQRPASEVLRELCERVQLVRTARRIFVRPYAAEVVERSVQALLHMAERSGLGLLDFWQALNQREAASLSRRSPKAVLVECAAQAKGKEFGHVILPYLQADEFPHPRQPRGDEENLFYVAATRTRQRLTLISPMETLQRSCFISKMQLPETSVTADAALLRRQTQAPAATGRTYLTASFHEKDQVKALGAQFDMARRSWYVESGRDLAPFASWIKK